MWSQKAKIKLKILKDPFEKCVTYSTTWIKKHLTFLFLVAKIINYINISIYLYKINIILWFLLI